MASEDNHLLNSFELADALLVRGFTRVTDPNRTKAHGFRRGDLPRVVYLKIAGPSGELRAVGDSPLVVHADDARRLRAGGSLSSGLILQDLPHKSAGLLEFRISGSKATPFGYDVAVQDEAALDALLLRLSTETSTPSGAATASSLGSTEIQFVEPGLPDTDEAVAAAIAIDRDPRCAGESPTTRLALINARMGQGGYRRRMLQLWQGQCAVTGCAEPAVLIASHAKSWAESSNIERLDEFNGLLLSAALDRLFDHGLISFADDGVMLAKRVLRSFDLQCLGLQLDARLRSLRPRHQLYLAAHRARFGF